MTIPRPNLGDLRLALLIPPLAALAGLLAACGGSGTPPSPSARPTASPSIRPQVTPAAGSPIAAQRIIDLATDKPASTIWGADACQHPDPCDFSNDLPALATGDVNGDGLDDLLIGARFGDGPQNGRKDSGEAYVVFGSRDLPPTVDLAAGEQGLTIYGALPGDNLGWSGAIADVNGDGVKDLILGAPPAQRSDNRSNTGVVYVVFGGPHLGGTIDLSKDKADLTLLGPDGAGFFGDSLASADVNGDGIADIIVGATFARRPQGFQRGGQQAGAGYVVFGATNLSGSRDMAQSQFDVAVYGAEEFDEAGNHVAGGDINGDGIGDLIIDAEAADGPDNSRSVAAEVYLIYGSHDFKKVLDVAAGDEDVTIFGAEQNDTLGFNLATGDLNGDGVADLLMTARLADGPDNRVNEGGEVHFLFGGHQLPRTIDLASDPDDTYLYGADPADFLGASLGVVDTDGDGRLELMTGTGWGDGPGNTRAEGGEAYILDASGLRGAVSVQAAPLKLVAYGAQPGDGFGAAMAAGDLNGDGAPELIVLAVGGDGPNGSRPDAGQLYIIKP